MNNDIQNIEFKLGRSVLILFLFQIAFLILAAVYVYVFTDLFKLIPASYISIDNIKFAGIACGSAFFGRWIEKRHPGMLDKKRIRKISLRCAMLNFMLCISILSMSIYVDYMTNKSIEWGEIALVVAFQLFITILTYFMQNFVITFSIKNWQKKQIKKALTVK